MLAFLRYATEIFEVNRCFTHNKYAFANYPENKFSGALSLFHL
jgi:hypothetical protein